MVATKVAGRRNQLVLWSAYGRGGNKTILTNESGTCLKYTSWLVAGKFLRNISFPIFFMNFRANLLVAGYIASAMDTDTYRMDTLRWGSEVSTSVHTVDTTSISGLRGLLMLHVVLTNTLRHMHPYVDLCGTLQIPFFFFLSGCVGPVYHGNINIVESILFGCMHSVVSPGGLITGWRCVQSYADSCGALRFFPLSYPTRDVCSIENDVKVYSSSRSEILDTAGRVFGELF